MEICPEIFRCSRAAVVTYHNLQRNLGNPNHPAIFKTGAALSASVLLAFTPLGKEELPITYYGERRERKKPLRREGERRNAFSDVATFLGIAAVTSLLAYCAWWDSRPKQPTRREDVEVGIVTYYGSDVDTTNIKN